MNTFYEIIISLTAAWFMLSAVVHVARAGKDLGPYKPEQAAVYVFTCVCIIAGLLFVLWSNR